MKHSSFQLSIADHRTIFHPKAAKYILFIKDRCLYPIFTLHVHVLISEFRYLRSNRYT